MNRIASVTGVWQAQRKVRATKVGDTAKDKGSQSFRCGAKSVIELQK